MMNEKYNKVEADELFDNVMMEVESSAQAFTKTLGYKQLNYREQQSAVEIIHYLGEFMFDYHLESMSLWSQRALEDVLVTIFPTTITANIPFFEKVEAVLVKFFEFLHFSGQQSNALELVDSVKKSSVLMLNEAHVIFKDSPEEKLFDLGDEMGLDMSDLSDLDRLYKFVSFFETPKKKRHKMKIVHIKEWQQQKMMMGFY
ncbi:hypothetical protein DOK76_00165 [Vagococcus sp. DIV0080]|uniref:Uncharacterized protein n=1 Tax=Candidatus Vagococcus giribetii TaxID=2230876 RepID=A0ABS3HNZ3_9ENTE|nr:hypothetical protein [Vagococcus sp. DIV0080]MBO0475459.1 hypothetical protein [Vagococcus sp. DIV0080]